jgi:hypothetical protein
MKFSAATVLATLLGSVSAKAPSDKRSFAVLRFNGKEIMRGRVDPIVNPGGVAGHVHGVMGGSNFGPSATGETMMNSKCSNAKIKGDNSAYWFPWLYFQDPKTGKLEPVDIFYVNVYYFFEASDDEIKAFPVGLQMLSGSASTRVAPAGGGGDNLDPNNGPVNAVQWTCPRSSYDPPSYPPNSDGSMAGVQDPNNKGAGAGFPFQNCDGYASPLRGDIHFPSCYNPAAGLTNYKQNMAWPTSKGASGGRQNCPPGYIHVPHIFFETYWDTPQFKDRWTPGSSQPFVLATGDVTGFSNHADFLAAWDEELLQHIIDTCDAGSSGMDNCAGLKYGLNDDNEKCTIPSPVQEVVTGVLDKLPGNNPLSGWKYGAASGGGAPAPAPIVVDPYAPGTSSPAAAPAPAETQESKPVSAAPPPEAPKNEAPKNNAPAPAATTPAPEASKSTACDLKIETVWETVTVYGTTTEHLPGPSPTAKSVAVNSTGATVAGFKYAGCFLDASDRALSGDIRPGGLGAVTNDKCIEHCKAAGFALAGTEYGGQCYCGDELVGSKSLDDATCNMPCEGDAAQTCGGGWALSVYSASGEASLKTRSLAAGDKMRRHVHKHANHALRHRSARK